MQSNYSTISAKPIIGDNSDPLKSEQGNSIKTECFTIRLSDELRIVAAMADAAKRKTNGSIFSVRVDISNTSSLSIGVKDLQDKLLAVSMLKRVNGAQGPVEEAGIRLGDVIFGVNFQPCCEGSKTLMTIVKKEFELKRKTLHLQCWRCKQLCSDPIPGVLFVRADDLIVQAFNMYRTKVFSDWERWNFIEILLDYMLSDLKMKFTNDSTPQLMNQRCADPSDPSGGQRYQILDLERNILQAKGLRTSLCVRIVHTRIHGETVVYVLRVEDVETGLQWVVHRRYRDFAALNDELSDLSHFTKDVAFPKKQLVSLRKNARVVEERIVALEQYIRRVLHVLTLYATMDPLASRSLRHLQNFLGVDRYIDCTHPPIMDDQRTIELQAYRLLNDFNSPACQQCIRFVSSVDLDVLVEDGPDGYKPMLKHLSLALAEVEAYVLDNHYPQMLKLLSDRRRKYSSEQCRVFIRRCVRRQVEAAVFLPLRRAVFRIVYSFVAVQAQCMQKAMGLLQQAAPSYFEVDPYILRTTAMPRAIKAFRDVIQAYLPADQGQLLMHAAAAVMQLHSECCAANKAAKRKSVKLDGTSLPDSALKIPEHSEINVLAEAAQSLSIDFTSKEAMADPVATIFHAYESTPDMLLSRTKSNRSMSLAVADRRASSDGEHTAVPPPILHSRRFSFHGKIAPPIEDDAVVRDMQKTVSTQLSPSAGAFLPLASDRLSLTQENMTPRFSEDLKRDAGKKIAMLQEKLKAFALVPNTPGAAIVQPEVAVEVDPARKLFEPLFPEDPNSPDVNSLPEVESFTPPVSVVKPKVADSPYFSPDEEGMFNEIFGERGYTIEEIASSQSASAEENKDGDAKTVGFYEKDDTQEVVSADDFLPMFTFVLVQASLPQLLLVKEVMTALVDDEETFGECGYYLATLEAATQHIVTLAEQFQDIDANELRFANDVIALPYSEEGGDQLY